MNRRLAGWCAFIGWVVIPGTTGCLFEYLPKLNTYRWPLWILDVYLAVAGVMFLAGTVAAIGARRHAHAGWSSSIAGGLCAIGLLTVISAATLGFHADVWYWSQPGGGAGIGSLAGSRKIAFAASSPPWLKDDRVPVSVKRWWLWHCLGQKQGYADATGGLAIPLRFEYASPFFDGFAKVYDSEGSGIIDSQGAWVIPPGHEFLSLRFAEGKLAAVREGHYGFLDLSDHWVIQPRFEIVHDFSEGIAAVKLNGAWGFVDGSDQLVIPPRFEDVRDFDEGLAPVKFFENAWGYTDRTGAVFIPPRFHDACCFHEGKARISFKAGSWLFIDPCGDVLEENAR